MDKLTGYRIYYTVDKIKKYTTFNAHNDEDAKNRAEAICKENNAKLIKLKKVILEDVL